MILAAIFAVLTAVGARITFQIGSIPLTLQMLFTLLAGTLIGAKSGGMSQLIYIMLGLAGIPVFAKGGGIHYVLEPSFGYILGFSVAAFVIGKLCEKNSKFLTVLRACLIGVAIIYAFGITYLYLILTLSLGSSITFFYAFWLGTGIMIWKDIVLCFVVAGLAVRLKPAIRKSMNGRIQA